MDGMYIKHRRVPQEPPKKFYISDTHFEHANIIRLAKRPFTDVNHMNQHMVDAWNDRVRDIDIVYHLGDFAWHNSEKWFNQLNGQKHFIEGNHDFNSEKLPWVSYHKYRSIQDEVDGKKYRVILFHFPICDWDGRYHGSLHLHGHVHGNLVPTPENAWDVGVECVGYIPRTLKEIMMYGRHGQQATHRYPDMPEPLKDNWSKMPKLEHPQ